MGCRGYRPGAAPLCSSLSDWYQKTVDGPSKLIAPAITIASGSYAIFKGYKYAEFPHCTIAWAITSTREERRLADARKQLRLIIERPNVDRRFREPIFLVPPLRRVVRELGWGKPLSSVHSSAT